MTGILDHILEDKDFEEEGAAKESAQADSTNPVEAAFSYPKMEADLGLLKK